jgi:uncharacterized protein
MADAEGFSATDLSTFAGCSHRTVLDLAVIRQLMERPQQNDLERRLLQLRGVDHERRVLEHYRSSQKNIATITAAPGSAGLSLAAEETLAAMKSGADVVYQGVLLDGSWSGRPDFLVKVPGEGPWGHHYEAVDAKLAREAKAAAVLQLCVYTDQLARLQGIHPKHFHIANRGTSPAPARYVATDYMAYYRRVRRWFDEFVASGEAPYPEPVEHCAVCPWWKRCEDRRRVDDHLSLVAGSTRRQRNRLAATGITKVVELAALDPDRTIDGIARDPLTKIREQARIQVAGRTAKEVIAEPLDPTKPDFGLAALPEPKPGDLFFDLEGDAFVHDRGLEYLFGLVELGTPETGFTVRKVGGEPRYHAFWATNDADEKRAFERVIDRITLGRQEFAEMHVFHYGHREADALKKLSCRHKTREAEVDDLLRSGALVDLLPIVRHGIRASVEAYTLKHLEPLHGFIREADLRQAARAMIALGWWLETGDIDPETVDELKGCIEAYNRDDCLSTWKLRDWLEEERRRLEQRTGIRLSRPGRREQDVPAEDRRARAQEVLATVTALTKGLPSEPSGDTEEQRCRRLMANLVEWHRREEKSGWWEYFRARDLPEGDRLADRAVLADLRYDGEVDRVKKSIVHRYTFPEQEHGIRKSPTPIDPATEKAAGDVVEIGAAYIHLKRSAASKVPPPRALIPGKPIATNVHEASLLAIAKSMAAGTMPTSYPVAHNLLFRIPPSDGRPGEPLVRDSEPTERALARWAMSEEGTVLPVQGPPGSGKTHQAAQMILALIRAGKRVGVTANSHEVIKNVLRKVFELKPLDVNVRARHLEDSKDATAAEPFDVNDDKPAARELLATGDLNLVGGTTWTWVTTAFERSVDVLIVDEAGQISLANALAVSPACTAMVLLGDPAQLDQPQKGVHPPGAQVSALEYLLGEDQTIAAHRGVFLSKTRRMHPSVCDFVSKVFYEGRLDPDPDLGLERQSIEGPGPFQRAGLRHVPVAHEGNTNHSPEEVARVAELVSGLLASRPKFTDRTGTQRPLTALDVLVVAPYNSQVAALRRALPAEILVGTVDKFQGKEAPVVIYSMATSSSQEAPRGLEFLYSLNRLNVAISRAQALAVIVASPMLTRTACQTPRQIKLVNALCSYLERASSP